MSNIAEFGAQIPENYIEPKEVMPHLSRFDRDRMIEFLSVLNRVRNFRVEDIPVKNIDFLYSPRSIIDGHFHPLLPYFEIPYMLTAGVANGLIIGEAGENSDRFKAEIVRGMCGILGTMGLSAKSRLSWSKPVMREIPGGLTNRTDYKMGRELTVADFYPISKIMSLRWYEVHPRFIYREEFRDYSLIAKMDSDLKKTSLVSGVLIMRFYVDEIAWVPSQRDGKPKLGSLNAEVLTNYLAPAKNGVILAEGDIRSLRFLQRLFMRALRLDFLFNEDFEELKLHQ